MVDFVCIGGKKCGTTWLYHQLSKNEKLNASKIKEPNYFSNKITKDISWYKNLWNKKSKGLKFECSANYIYSKDAIESLVKEYPNCKLILMYRDHVSRSVSHYYFLKRNYKVKNILNFIKENYDNIVRYSLLYPQLKILHDLHLLPKTLLINFNDIQERPETVIKKISKFLNVKLNYYNNLDKGTGYTPKILILEKVRNTITEYILHRFMVNPKKIILLKYLDYIYKNLFTTKNQKSHKIKKIIIEHYLSIFEEDKRLVKKNFGLKI